ncbi:MAG: putative CoA-transferase [Candidatus Methanofastidiosum methylothiophilum]|uniref:Putative CoA-transferase n=1 Tax=Candidatus Methanofastidiosum methylothiophilum TaxID=1705564 RepID=A0A150IHV2_9EURY|nr:MAG: putative CoA-transferase [Candidatus Methanofastidiosum methylthiophilus]KYC46955.1 MAG: putative CoA-transferase [Candidatus Methanofastidiosum methylthiophilus]KYC49186.1 MAG: putative CoA-transferase [Candidatus Methanofastidiosum methylthiophilus]
MKPLEGVRILDLSHVLAMPYCTMILGDLGAEIIKIEKSDGEDSRKFGPYKNGESAYFMSVNRNKKSVVLNLKEEKGKEILRELIKICDVITENFRPGTMEKLGFSYENIKKINPNIIYATISQFGSDTLYPGRPGYDIIAQAYGGLMSITGFPDNPPTRVGSSIADIMSGMFSAIGILGALRVKDKTGESQYIDTAMVDCIIAILENAVVRYTVLGEVPQRIGSRHPSLTPFDVFKANDGYIVIGIGNDHLWEMFCKNIPEFNLLIMAERFKNNELRTKNEAELKKIIEDWTQKHTTEDLVRIITDAGVPCGPVNTVDKILKDPNTEYRKMLFEFDHPVAGKMITSNSPLNLSLTPCKDHLRPPALGEHTDEVLTSVLGYSKEKIEELKKDKIIWNRG